MEGIFSFPDLREKENAGSILRKKDFLDSSHECIIEEENTP